MNYSPCPNCGSHEIYRHSEGTAGDGMYSANYLKGLGSFMKPARFHPVICETCGLARFFVSKESCQRLKKSRQWDKVQTSRETT